MCYYDIVFHVIPLIRGVLTVNDTHDFVTLSSK